MNKPEDQGLGQFDEKSMILNVGNHRFELRFLTLFDFPFEKCEEHDFDRFPLCFGTSLLHRGQMTGQFVEALFIVLFRGSAGRRTAVAFGQVTVEYSMHGKI